MSLNFPESNTLLRLNDPPAPDPRSGTAPTENGQDSEAGPGDILSVDRSTLTRGRYTAEISRRNPGCLVFLIDQSGSMDEPIAGATGARKKQVVADAVNRLLYNAVLRCAREDVVRPYFSLGAWSYGGTDAVSPLFGPGLVSVADIADRPLRTEVRQRRVPDGAGGVFEEEFQLPVWIEPVALGLTPMNVAFRAVVEPIRAWLAQYPESFPPIIVNLTDGAYTGESPAPIARELMALTNSEGGVLIFNCHISRHQGSTITFPDDSHAGAFTGLARELYDFSSTLPDAMRRQALAKGYQPRPGARGYAFNADFVTLVDFLDIGTRVIQDRAEAA